MGEEAAEGSDVFEARGDFEAGVDVDTDALRVMEGIHSLGIIGADAAAKQERCAAVVGREDAPVELLAIATNRLAFRVEEKKLDEPFIGFGLREVIGSGDIESLDDTGSIPAYGHTSL